MENKKDYRIMKAIPARKKMEFMRKAENMESKKEIFDYAKKTALFYADKENWTNEEKKTACLSLYACGLCVWNMKRAENVFDYIVDYIIWKQRIFEKLNDLGAFGDSIETIVHLVACRKIWRTNKKNLHVSEIDKTDVKINSIRFEVAHNGKTWAESTENEPMQGHFDGVIYGVFDTEETENIINLFRIGKVMEGIKTVCNMLYVFPDKMEHLNFMDSISTRSATIQYKSNLGRYMTIYNPSKHTAFINAIENSNYKTLSDYMNSLGENDYTGE